MSLKHYVPRDEYLLVLLLLLSALLMAASTPVAEEEVEQQQQEYDAMNEKCLFKEGSITCTGNTTCCSSGQYNNDVPECIDPSTEDCCLYGNTSFACASSRGGSCCGSVCCSQMEGFCCPIPNNFLCCSIVETCAYLPDSPCLPFCGSNGTCPEPFQCCGGSTGFCYVPSTMICCGDVQPWVCSSEQTCGTQWECCDKQSCGGQCYDWEVTHCCSSGENTYTCPNTESCCSYGSGATANGTCCPSDTSCCGTVDSVGASCCYANQTCCANGSSSPVCCNEGEVCDWTYGQCVTAMHDPEKEGRQG